MLDNGDALMWKRPDKNSPECREYFESLERFSPYIYERLQDLTDDDLVALWVDHEGEPLTDDPHYRVVANRAAEVVQRIELLIDQEDAETVFFPTSSNAMAMTE